MTESTTDSMQIASVETFVLKVKAGDAYLGTRNDGSPVPTGYHVRPPWRSIYSDRFETLLVKITAADGTSGWGEALAPVAPEVAATIVQLLLQPLLVGSDATRPRPTSYVLAESMRERGHLVGHQADALAAVDIALWDLAGRILGCPVSALLGGAFRERIETYVSGLPSNSDEGRAALARQWQARGWRSVKLHLGNGVEKDLSTLAAVAAAAPQLRIGIDAHWAYDLPSAHRLATRMDELGGWFLEAPIAPEDDQGHVELRARHTTPIAVGELLRSRHEFARLLAARAIGIAQPDVGRTGITEAMAIAELCDASHTPVAPHHSVGQGVLLAAGLQLSAAVRNFLIFEYQPTSTEVGNQLLKQPLVPRAGAFDVPSGPGLGVEVDEDYIRAASLEAS